MKKIIYFLLSAMILSPLGYAQLGKKIPAVKYLAKLTIVSHGGTLTPIQEGSNAIITKRDEGGIDAIYEARSTRWRTMKVAFIAEADMSATIFMMSNKPKTSMYFDNIKINGKLIPNGDFQNGLNNWKIKDGKPFISSFLPRFQGDKCISSASWHRFLQVVKFKKGDKIEFNVDVAVNDSWNDCQIVDLSKAVNASYKGENLPKDIKPFNKLRPRKNPIEVAGMKFKVLRPQKETGFATLATSESKDEVEVDLSDNPLSGKYLYVLHTLGRGFWSFAKIKITFADGRERTLDVRNTVDVADSDKAPQAYDNALPVYTTKGDGVIYMSRFDLKGGDHLGLVKKIKLLSKKNWMIFAMTISSREVRTTENYVFDPKIWKPVSADSYEVKAGTALDFSATVEAPAGKYGRVVVGKSGNFEFADKPNEPVRFKSANFFSLICQFGTQIKTHEEIDRYVAMLKKQGFNALRWRFVMNKREFEAPYKMHALNRDLYDYFLYALGREGIYSFFYLCSHDTGDPSFTWNDRFTVKVKMMLGEKDARQAWRKLAKMQLEHINPYTKKAWKDDPSIATIEYWNEFELGVSSYPSITAEGKELLKKKFAQYLSKHFKNVNDFLSYCEKVGKPWKQDSKAEKFEDLDISNWGNRSSNPVYARFIIEAMTDMQDFCRKVICDEIGMKVPTHQNNCMRTVHWTYLSAIAGNYTAINVYHCHPSSYSLGAEVRQVSSLVDGGSYWRGTVAKRVAGMPIAVTEYQHCYFNKFAHEAGVLFPAYSALNGYDALVAFDSPVSINGGRLGFFNIGVNPVFRVNDFLTYFLFYRGDVKRSPHRVDVEIDKNFMEKDPLVALAINEKQRMISLMTGLAVNFPDVKRNDDVEIKPADIKMKPFGATEVIVDQQFTGAGKNVGKDYPIDDFVATLKDKGILDKSNISNPSELIFQSDTGEITMYGKKREMTVITPKSVVAIVNENSKLMQLGELTINSFNRKGTIGVVSIDNKPLAESSRMVLAIATDNVPSDVELSASRRKLGQWGKLPILIETGQLSATLKVSDKKYTVYPLKISGERLDAIPIENSNGTLKLDIDTSKNPSMYFEIVAE